MKLSLCIPTYNRPEMTIEAFEKVYTDNRIGEIVIVDDCSQLINYYSLKQRCDLLIGRHGINKIRLLTNDKNKGMSRNKMISISEAKNDWCILFDSDNILDRDYLDAFWNNLTIHDGDMPLSNIIYCPTFAKPDFNYTSLDGKVFSPIIVKHEIAENNALNMAMNTCNYIVNKKEYLRAYKYNKEHIASDTIWFNYNWLKQGNCFYFVPNMHYFHRVHKGSGFMQNSVYNMKKAEEVKKLIMEL